ncbi:ASNSD1 upstream open reading frame protein-like isoform X2 [Lytechinus variegatus]|uniref:ASNSD1 upstream open reading frame protein-like isoform X2 n=1 Tax=Lytechinus variegatus TaxID=7654 RepID=UPI001BB11017|nr:ASNSD1 upstream open reading frame protein-like isoform X2 [Lytechinus variegatus]
MAAPMGDFYSTSNVGDAEKIHVNRQISELQVLQSELSSLKKNAVYTQQQNSNVFFLSDKAHCQSRCKSQIETLEKMKAKQEQR